MDPRHVKRLLARNVDPRVKVDDRGVDLANSEMSLIPFNEFVVKEAVHLK